ncbi:hypothetical protein I7I48_10342 [Histoplasma ohiense]|nr:hypothetical protein I7I48_10342 [Histoplasma ohiense (nom. inval.)]
MYTSKYPFLRREQGKDTITIQLQSQHIFVFTTPLRKYLIGAEPLWHCIYRHTLISYATHRTTSRSLNGCLSCLCRAMGDPYTLHVLYI